MAQNGAGAAGNINLFAILMSVAVFVRNNPPLKLAACVLIDILGVATYLLPFLGEAIDVAWAPVSAFFLHFMFQSSLITMLGFLEELGPGTDIVPTATLAWFLENTDLLVFLRNMVFNQQQRGQGRRE